MATRKPAVDKRKELPGGRSNRAVLEAHCGHPTALWPYILLDRTGKMFLTGAAVSGRADFGTAWPSVASAMDYVAAVQNRQVAAR